MHWKDDKNLNDARKFFDMAMLTASAYGLQHEFVESYKTRRREGNGILDSIHYSCAEWDLY